MTAALRPSHRRPTAALASGLRWAGAMGVVGIAVMRCLIVFAPQVYFDVDPAFDPSPLAGLGPAGSLTLDALLLVFAGLALAGEALSNRGVEWWLLLLALAPLPVICWHGWNDLGDLWRGLTWQASFIALTAAAHLARDAALRVTMLALLMAVVAPLIVRGAAQMTFEHAETVASFERNKAQFLADHGWEPGSSAAEIYERRLRQPQPLGWFATTNIFASVQVAAMIALLGMSVGLWRARLPRPWPWLSFFLAALCLTMIVFTGSKGAWGVLLITGALCLAPLTLSHGRALTTRFGPVMLITLPVIGLLAIAARGVMLPEQFAGERSLLFRWHYLVGATEIFTDSAASGIAGIGPDGFQDAYIQHRPPRSPEEVASSHSMFVDWLTTLGVCGAAWIALVIALLIRAGRSLREQTEYISGEDIENVMQRLARCAIIVLVLALIPAIVVELHALNTLHLVWRIVGAVAFTITTLLVGYLALHIERAVLSWCVASAAGALVLHGQIEMTFFQPAFAVWAMCLIGLSAPAAILRGRNSRPGLAAASTAILLGLAVFWFGAAPAWRQQTLVRHAASSFHPPAASDAEQASQRQRAAALLEAAAAIRPQHDQLTLRAAREYERAAQRLNGEDRVTLLVQAMEVLDQFEAEHDGTPPLALHGTRASVATQLAVAAGDESWLERAIDDALVLTRRDPHSPLNRVRLGDLYWMTGGNVEAADAYRTALQKSENFALDPLKQLPHPRQALIKDRLQTLKASEGSGR